MIHDDKVVLWGMSCVGKTTMAVSMKDHHYHCFDALFDWHSIETLNLSISTSLCHISKQCTQDRYVLDGWHLSDKSGELLPPSCTVYVLYANYDNIIKQYRVKVNCQNEHKHMFYKWYHDVDYDLFSNVRYFENIGTFEERDNDEFKKFLFSNEL